jgi:L-threonylcarbamoyladenylate synthase
VSRLLAAPFPRQGFFDSSFFPGFQVKRVFLDLLDDVFLLHLALEAAQSIFQRLTILKSHFRQNLNTPVSVVDYECPLAAKGSWIFNYSIPASQGHSSCAWGSPRGASAAATAGFLTHPQGYVTVCHARSGTAHIPGGIMAEILKVDESRLKFVLEYSARMILAGKVVAVPTDTLYGLAADPFNLAAVSEVNRIKRRTTERALPLLVDSVDQAADLAHDPPRLFFQLAERFWPGPLTLVVTASRQLPLKITGNTGKVGLRWPKAPVVVGLIAACARPLTGTSANLTDHPPSTSAEEVERQIGRAVTLILDGGPTPAHVPSTVVDLAGERARVIRPGGVPESELKEFLG